MDILNTVSLESNSQIKINFDGGDLSSDAGLLLFKEFLFKNGAIKLIHRIFKTNDTAWFRIHKDDANLMQVIYQIISAYFEDDCADELTNEPVMTAILDKDALASQPTLSRFDAKTNDKTIQRVNNVRNAFNSPFRPFVLATTSVGQEGLDFHLYSRKVVHWNLPSNPIDLEQREGRINRYMCHAIRQNVAANENALDWDEKFAQTKEKYGQGTSEMIPYWCLPDDYPFKYQIERIVPMYPFSHDKTNYDRLINVRALYRLTLGQPRQEEMIAILQREDLSKEQMEELFLDLSPYSRNKKKCNFKSNV